MKNTRESLRYASRETLEKLMADMRQPSYRIKQLVDWLFTQRVSSFDDMTNLPKDLRETLAERFSLSAVSERAHQLSSDGTVKYLLELNDGAFIECVAMPSAGKLSVCVSVQAGCGMGCAFCATGKLGLTRSLSAEEICDQVVFVESDFGRRVSSVVLMGQGEPFANYDNVMRAMRLMNSPDFLNIGARHITVSTCGIIPKIIQFSKEPEQFTLAVSLHSALPHTRNRLMPGVKRYSLNHLYEALGNYVDTTGRRPSYEYALIAGVNDTPEELDALCAFCEGNLCHVNLIKLNEVDGSPFKPSSPDRVRAFIKALEAIGVEVSVRESRGADIDAACGQLARKV